MKMAKTAKIRLLKWFRSQKLKPAVFELWREEDRKKISGTGHVLDGVVFPDGTTVVRWRRRSKQSTAVFSTFKQFEQVHLTKHGQSTLKWVEGFDGITFVNVFLAGLSNELDMALKVAAVADKNGLGMARGIINGKIKDLSINRTPEYGDKPTDN